MGAPVIDEVQLPTDISRGAVGGAGFATVVIVGASGGEQRQAQWQQPRYSFQIDFEARNVTTGNTLIVFFVARQGRSRGFRFKDWTDYAASNETMVTTGLPYLQAQRTYTSGPVSYTRTIHKVARPTDGAPTPTLRKNGVALVPDDIDYNTGTFLLPILRQRAITGITKAASAVVTVPSGHGLATNDLVYFRGVSGMTEINGLVGTVTATASTTITVNINSSGFTTYTSGGLATKYCVVSDVFDWTGQFDIPVRFDQDQMKLTQEDVTIRSWQGIQIIEIQSGNLQPTLSSLAASELTATGGS